MDSTPTVKEVTAAFDLPVDPSGRALFSQLPTCESSGSSDSINAQPFSGSENGNRHTDRDTARETARDIVKSVVRGIARDNIVKTASKSSVLQTSQSASLASFRANPRGRTGDWKSFGTSVNQYLKVDEVVEKIDSGRLWVVNSRRRNGLIVLRKFHAEFAGPGAAVGGDLDDDIVKLIPIGNLSLLEPSSHEAHQSAIKIRLQWIRLTQDFTDQPSPDDRARKILEQFKTYFDQSTVDTVPDEAFALLVGVFPQTIRRARSEFVW